MDTNHDPSLPYAPIKQISQRPVAVAVQGNQQDPDLPAKIVAAGRGKIAEQILEMAFAKGIKVREDADLAELLAKLELDTPIPSEAVIAVAEILAKVYQANASISPA